MLGRFWKIVYSKLQKHTIMALLEKAGAFILQALLENEEFKKFPKDFVTESVLWVRSWFLKDDPKMEEKLQSDKSEDYKLGVVESKLETLWENPQFKQELESKLEAMERHAAAMPQIIQQKNVISNSPLTAGRDIHIGDKKEAYKADGNILITNNYGSQPAAEQAPVSPMTKPAVSAQEKEELRQWIGQTRVKEAIDRLARLSVGHDAFRNIVIGLANRWDQVKNQEMMGTLNFFDAGTEKQRIVSATLDLIREIDAV